MSHDGLRFQTLPQSYFVHLLDKALDNQSAHRLDVDPLAQILGPKGLTIVTSQDDLPEALQTSGPWRAFYLDGSFGFSESGILSRALAPLADSAIGVLVFSTFESDLILVQSKDLEGAKIALSRKHTVQET